MKQKIISSESINRKISIPAS